MSDYKKGDYVGAIATLSQLNHAPSRTHRLKAGMGLVRTYMAQQEWIKAKTLCQKIGHSSKPAVQQWAATTLKKIESRASHPTAHADDNLSIFHYAYLNQAIGPEPDEDIVDQPDNEPVNDQLITDQPYNLPNAGRLNKGRSLGKIKKGSLWIAPVAGASSFYALSLYWVQEFLPRSSRFFNVPLRGLDRLLPMAVRQLPETYSGLAWLLAGCLGGLAIASPWLWDLWLRSTAQVQAFSNQKLREYSPEAATLLGQQCHQQQWPFPKLWKLPTAVPLIFSYGWLPRNARLVVSEGLLTDLAADEIAALVGYEMAHWKTGHWAFLSTQGLVLQLFHQLYWQLSLWGNRQAKPLYWLTGVLATLSYCLFWLARIPGLWVSRVRTYVGDRTATERTGNPNGLTRALVKLSFSLARGIQTQGYTPPILESMALMLPVDADLNRQSLYGHMPLEQLFAWDNLNPIRHWMSLNDSHPPLGDRLRLLMAYAQHWKLDPELHLPQPRRQHQKLSPSEWALLISQGTPFFGLAIGLLTGLLLLTAGAFAHWLKQPALDWMYKETGLVLGCIFLGTGIGTVLRINRFFPDLPSDLPLAQSFPPWIQWLSDPHLLPVSSLPAQLSGILLGRPGIANWLGQDLLLHINAESPSPISPGLLKLHFFSALGPLGNVVRCGSTPAALIGQSVQILGWFRRGNRLWLDLNKLWLNKLELKKSVQQSPNSGINASPSLQAAHPMYSLLLAIITSGYGIWLLGLGQMWQEVWAKIMR